MTTEKKTFQLTYYTEVEAETEEDAIGRGIDNLVDFDACVMLEVAGDAGSVKAGILEEFPGVRVAHVWDMLDSRSRLAAISARIMGWWDHPVLMRFGPMTGNLQDDITAIISFEIDTEEAMDDMSDALLEASVQMAAMDAEEAGEGEDG